MQTRSKTKKVAKVVEEKEEEKRELEVMIDFEEASRAWRENKISKGNGQYVYRCTKCRNQRLSGKEYCRKHAYPANRF